MDTCKVCGRKCKNKNLTTIGGQKACSIHCAINIIPLENDKCSQCGAPVWINDLYKINGLMCCSKICKEEVEERTKSLRSKKKSGKKQSDFLETYQQNEYEKENEKKNENDYGYSGSKNNEYTKSNSKNNNFTSVNYGETNYALGPRSYNTTDYDVGPGNQKGNLYHGDPNFNNYNNYNNNYYNNDDDDDEEDEAYGDYDQRNYLREYGEHNYVQKNDGKSGDVMKELGMKANEGKDKPKNEVHQTVHHGNDVSCEYCGFSIKDGSTVFIDNFGKVFDTNECFSNHFQGIPKPNFGY